MVVVEWDVLQHVKREGLLCGMENVRRNRSGGQVRGECPDPPVQSNRYCPQFYDKRTVYVCLTHTRARLYATLSNLSWPLPINFDHKISRNKNITTAIKSCSVRHASAIQSFAVLTVRASRYISRTWGGGLIMLSREGTGHPTSESV